MTIIGTTPSQIGSSRYDLCILPFVDIKEEEHNVKLMIVRTIREEDDRIVKQVLHMDSHNS